MRSGEESIAEYRYSSKTQCAICAVVGGGSDYSCVDAVLSQRRTVTTGE